MQKIKENDIVTFQGRTGVVQVKHEDWVVVRFRDGSLRIFNMDGTLKERGNVWAKAKGQDLTKSIAKYKGSVGKTTVLKRKLPQ